MMFFHQKGLCDSQAMLEGLEAHKGEDFGLFICLFGFFFPNPVTFLFSSLLTFSFRECKPISSERLLRNTEQVPMRAFQKNEILLLESRQTKQREEVPLQQVHFLSSLISLTDKNPCGLQVPDKSLLNSGHQTQPQNS